MSGAISTMVYLERSLGELGRHSGQLRPLPAFPLARWFDDKSQCETPRADRLGSFVNAD